VNETTAMNVVDVAGSGGVQRLGNVKLEMPMPNAADAAQFRAMLEHQMADPAYAPEAPGLDSKSLGKVVAGRVNDLASEFLKDQQYVSKLLEKATRTGDSMQLMRAMMALNDYQIRVQAMSKTVSKTAAAVDQLTKMQ
jgi:hypothetical protein